MCKYLGLTENHPFASLSIEAGRRYAVALLQEICAIAGYLRWLLFSFLGQCLPASPASVEANDRRRANASDSETVSGSYALYAKGRERVNSELYEFAVESDCVRKHVAARVNHSPGKGGSRMAHASSKQLARSLDLLGHSVGLTFRLGDLAGGNHGRVAVLRGRLQRAQAELDAHRRSKPFDKRLVSRKADQVLGLLIEYMTAIIAESVEGA